MEFILNNKKYSIINHELFINYLMVDSYFKDHCKYDYDISFDFLKPVLSKEKKRPGTLSPTGWRSRNNVVSRSHLLLCSLNMMDIASISWIHRDIRISQRIRTVH